MVEPRDLWVVVVKGMQVRRLITRNDDVSVRSARSFG